MSRRLCTLLHNLHRPKKHYDLFEVTKYRFTVTKYCPGSAVS